MSDQARDTRQLGQWHLEHYLQFIPLRTTPFPVGRGNGTGLDLSLSVVSRQHAELRWEEDPGHWVVRDLGSRNGTFVNDQPIQEATPLAHGDWLRFASVEVRLVRLAQPATPASAGQRTDLLAPLPARTLPIRDKIERSIHHNIRMGTCTAQDLADSLNVERTTLYRHVIAEFGLSPSDLLRQKRLDYAAQLLREGGLPIQQVSDRAGFESAAHFSRAFKKQFGVNPRRYQHPLP